MKKIFLITCMISLVVLFIFGCKKKSSQDEIKAQLIQTQTQLTNDYKTAKSNADTLKLLVGLNGQFTNPLAFKADSIYHLNDSLFLIHYNSFCKEMMNGENTMGSSNMMSGSNTMSGSNMMTGTNMQTNSMMTTHTFLGDTAKVNFYYRDLNSIRLTHNSFHPVKPADHLLHHL